MDFVGVGVTGGDGGTVGVGVEICVKFDSFFSAFVGTDEDVSESFVVFNALLSLVGVEEITSRKEEEMEKKVRTTKALDRLVPFLPTLCSLSPVVHF